MNLKSTLKSLKLHESTLSMVLGALVVVVAGVLLINYFSGKRGETVPPLEIEEENGTKTHTVAEGEDLWKISEKYYGTGFEWSKIAEANNISDPNQIETGQTLIIPATEGGEIAQAEPTSQEKLPTLSVTKAPEQIVIPTQVLKQEEKVAEKPIEKSEHTVAKGETLWAIAEKYYKSGYNWVDISRENKLENPGLIEEGQKLTIPSVEPKIATVISNTKAVAETESITGNTYTVKRGDSLWSIAVRAYGDGYRWPEIAKENNLTKPGLIHPGNALQLPR